MTTNICTMSEANFEQVFVPLGTFVTFAYKSKSENWIPASAGMIKTKMHKNTLNYESIFYLFSNFPVL